VPVYGSGGFTSYDDDTLRRQLHHWISGLEIPRVKIKIGESWGGDVPRDLQRTAFTREVVGDDVELYVDANGGYTTGQAVRVAQDLTELGVVWFEEPVSSDDLAGLANVRGKVVADVAAGEYAYDLAYVRRMCVAGAVDCLQLDVTRIAGITDWMRAAAVASAHNVQVSAHCAPNLHLHPATAIPNLRHAEYFHDHARIEQLLFCGAIDPTGGQMRPDLSKAGHGLTLNRSAGACYRAA
jgi:L-alanine-DL-glutamate epimerase-like enolase superfamily enzyme